MNNELENGVDLVNVAENTIRKTIFGICKFIIINIIVIFAFGIIIGSFLPVISFYFLFISKEKIDWLAAPVKNYNVWRLKMFLGCWIIGIICWIISNLSYQTFGL